ncbi:tail fiber assembly protein [Providencia sp. JUb39]|uniref:tail fiber assembly protein n=1 Tax=Providencia sp. JUb39 TaxID=2724165 RepID=UPI00164D75A4|nr:tail fiber assembly protein [Providencia sp. JUb39]MBC5791098.1 tail fiber assembly protein [Providencia sp. JUb39]
MSLTKKFERYIPEEDHYSNVIYLRNIDGDWYKQQSNFANNSLKVLYDDNGFIISMHHDVSMLYPDGAYICELDANTHVNIDIHKIKDGKLYEYQSIGDFERAHVELNKKQLLFETSNIIDTLQDAVDIGIATEKEIEKLKELREYRISIIR